MSRPQLAESGGFSRDGQIKQSGLQVFVRPTNSVLVGMGTNWVGYNSISPTQGFRKYSYYPNAHTLEDFPGKFYVEFFVRTERPLILNLNDFFLTLPDGESRKPVAYIGSLSMHSTANYSLTLCHPNLLRESSVDMPIVIRGAESMCFAAIYDVDPPMPSELFSVAIDGIVIDGERLSLPAVFFEQSKEISYHP